MGAFQNKDAEGIYQFLKLDHIDTDYYLMGALTALTSFPQLLDRDAETAFPWEITGFEVPRCKNATLVGSHRPPNLVWHPEVLPESIYFNLVLDSPGVFKVSHGTHVSTLSYQTAPNGDVILGNQFHDVFPPVEFSLGDWNGESPIEIVIPPTSYPYGYVSDYLSSDEAAIMVLHRHGLLEAFSSSIDPFYRVALIVSALTKEPLIHGQ